MKKAIFFLVLLSSAFTNRTIAQEEGKFRVGLDLGYTVPYAGGGGLLFYLEPKYNIRDNMNIGFRIGGAAMVRDIISYSNNNEIVGKMAVNASYVLTYDYYFKREGSNFAPFIGAGIGWMRFASIEFDSAIDAEDYGDLSANSAFAPVLRAGFEASKFRLSLDYNFVPRSDLVDTQGNIIGETSNSYLGIAVGFYVGGGKWRN